MAHLAAFEERFPLEWVLGSVATLYFSYVASISLVAFLDAEPAAAGAPFAQACRHFHAAAASFPVAAALLSGLQAAALELGVALPRGCEGYFERAGVPRGGEEEEDAGDVPIGYIIPDLAEVADQLGGEDGEDDDSDALGVELGGVIEKWSALTA